MEKKTIYTIFAVVTAVLIAAGVFAAGLAYNAGKKTNTAPQTTVQTETQTVEETESVETKPVETTTETSVREKTTAEKQIETTVKQTTTEASTTAKQTQVSTQSKNAVYSLTVSYDTGVAEATGAGKYKAGTKVTVNAVPLLGYTFVEWVSSDEAALANGKTASYTFTMPEKNITLKASTTNKPLLTVIAGEGIEKVTDSKICAPGENITLQATVKNGYEFSGWTSDVDGFNSSKQSYAFAMPKKSLVITANATPKIFTVTVSAGTGIGGVSGSGQYKYGQQVTVSATVKSNYTFSGWSGGVSSSSAKYTFSMPARNIAVTANAKENPKYTLTVEKGTGIKAVSTGGTYYAGTSVTVSCTLESGYAFSKWYSSNANALKGGTSQSFTFKMPKANIKLTAVGTKNAYTVNVVKGKGIKAVNGGGTYAPGAKVTVSCTPETGYVFSSWASSNTELVKNGSTQSYTFTMPKSGIKLTAYAKLNQYTLTLKSSEGIESVTGAGKYTPGTGVVVNCTVKKGYVFDKWTSSKNILKGSAVQNYSFAMPNDSVTLTAVAKKNTYKVTLTKGEGIYSVSGSGTFEAGTQVTIQCTLTKGYVFRYWKSSRSSTVGNGAEQTYTFTMPSCDIGFTATAAYNRYTLTTNKGTGISTISRSGEKDSDGKFTADKQVTVNCEVKTGYEFDRWTSSDTSAVATGYSQEYTFTMPRKAITLTAKAKLKEYEVIVGWDDGVYDIGGYGMYEYMESVTLTVNYDSENYIFVGWYDINTEKIRSRNTTYTFNMPAEDISLLAQVRPK